MDVSTLTPENITTIIGVCSGLAIVIFGVPVIIKLVRSQRRILATLAGLGMVSTSSGSAFVVPTVTDVNNLTEATLTNVATFIEDIHLQSLMITATVCIIAIMGAYFLLTGMAKNKTNPTPEFAPEDTHPAKQQRRAQQNRNTTTWE